MKGYIVLIVIFTLVSCILLLNTLHFSVSASPSKPRDYTNATAVGEELLKRGEKVSQEILKKAGIASDQISKITGEHVKWKKDTQFYDTGNNNGTSDNQSEEKTFTSPKFGLSMKYPADWTFVPGEQDFSPGIFDYSVVTPPGFASLGEFCPTSFVGAEPKVLDCQHNSPVTFGIIAFKLKDGSTLKEFYDKIIDSSEQLKRLNPTKNIETNKIFLLFKQYL